MSNAIVIRFSHVWRPSDLEIALDVLR